MRAPAGKTSSRGASRVLLAGLLVLAACLEFRADDKPFLCEGAACAGGGTAGGELGGGVGGGGAGGNGAGGNPGGGNTSGGNTGGGSDLDAGTDAGLFVNAEGRWLRIASPFEGDARFGAALAFTSDGRTVIVGAPGFSRDAGTGAVAVFRLTDSQATLERTFAPPTNDEEFGAAVSVNGSGERVLVGAPGNRRVQLVVVGGSAWLFRKQLSGIVSPFPVPTPSQPRAGSRFGAAVSQAAAADFFAVAAPLGARQADAGAMGTVDVFSFDGGAISFESAIVDSRVEEGDFFGTSVGLTAVGTTLVVTAPGDDRDGNGTASQAPDSGAAYAFVKFGAIWSRQWVFKDSTGAKPGGAFGSCGAMAAAPKAVFGGATPLAVVFEAFERSFSAWGFASRDALGGTSTIHPGCAISADGQSVLGSALGRVSSNDGTGAREVALPPQVGASLGESLALSADASVLAFGEPGAADGGAVWILWR